MVNFKEILTIELLCIIIICLYLCNANTNNIFMENVNLCKFEKAYIISMLSPNDIMGISPQYFTAKVIGDKLKTLLDINNVRILIINGAITIIGIE